MQSHPQSAARPQCSLIRRQQLGRSAVTSAASSSAAVQSHPPPAARQQRSHIRGRQLGRRQSHPVTAARQQCSHVRSQQLGRSRQSSSKEHYTLASTQAQAVCQKSKHKCAMAAFNRQHANAHESKPHPRLLHIVSRHGYQHSSGNCDRSYLRCFEGWTKSLPRTPRSGYSLLSLIEFEKMQRSNQRLCAGSESAFSKQERHHGATRLTSKRARTEATSASSALEKMQHSSQRVRAGMKSASSKHGHHHGARVPVSKRARTEATLASSTHSGTLQLSTVEQHAQRQSKEKTGEVSAPRHKHKRQLSLIQFERMQRSNQRLCAGSESAFSIQERHHGAKKPISNRARTEATSASSAHGSASQLSAFERHLRAQLLPASRGAFTAHADTALEVFPPTDPGTPRSRQNGH